MMNRAVIAAIFALLIALSACAQATIRAQPLNNTPPPVADKCAGMNCGENAYCDAGVCMCDGGFKKCGNKCIAQRLCCDNSECKSSEKVCSEGVCVDRPLCGFNEEWDPGSKSCICAEGAKFCKEQGKCIPAKSCCAHFDCRFGRERCAVTTYSGTICFRYAGTKKCSVAHEGNPVQFVTMVGDFKAQMQKVLEGPRFDLRVNNDSIRRVRINESNTVANGTAQVYVESMELFGGYCREEPE